MAATYDLASKAVSPDGLQHQAPHWVVGIARYAKQVSWDPSLKSAVSENDDDVRAERNALVLTSSVQTVTVSTAKESHVTNLNMVLKPTYNFLTKIMPGDWVVCCIVSGDETGKALAERMIKKEAINRWEDGLKFVGKVSSCRQTTDRNRGNGQFNCQYDVQAVGFSEFNSDLYYNEAMQRNQTELASLHEFGLVVRDLATKKDDSINGGMVDINKIIPKLVQVIFGQGVWANNIQTAMAKSQMFLDVSGDQPDFRTSPPSPNTKYLVPKTVLSWLGVDGKTYNDILNTVIGVQHYKKVSSESNETKPTAPWELFKPDDVEPESGRVLRMKDKRLMGWFSYNPPPTNTQVWNFMSSFMAHPINEMFVALKSDPFDGSVMPTLTLRQLPYSSPDIYKTFHKSQEEYTSKAKENAEKEQAIAKDLKNVVSSKAESAPPPDATSFLELPRWKIGREMVYRSDIGRADALRFNMVFVSIAGSGSQVDPRDAAVRAPPLTDSMDIKRHGLRAYTPNVNCFWKESNRPPKAWRDLMADIVMGQHLTLTGQITCVGITAPIAPGDNLEFEGIVYHIEAVTHTAGMDFGGNRSFQTVLALSHGVESESRSDALKSSDSEWMAREGYIPGTSEQEVDLGVTIAVARDDDAEID